MLVDKIQNMSLVECIKQKKNKIKKAKTWSVFIQQIYSCQNELIISVDNSWTTDFAHMVIYTGVNKNVPAM